MKLNLEQRWDLNIEKQKKGITNREIAEALGISPSAVSHYFKGRSSVSKETELKIIRYIKDKKYYVLEEVEKPF